MKKIISATLLFVVSFKSSLSFAQATSVNGAYKDSKKSNTMGLIANVAGGGLHAINAYQNWGMCASCYGSCSACAMAVVQTMAAVSSFGQAGAHGSSNQNLIPDMCKTAAGICNPNAFNWPDFNSCPTGNATCYSNVINNSNNPDLDSLFKGDGVSTGPGTTTSTAFSDYDKMMKELTKAGGSYDPKTGNLTFNGQTFNPKDFQKPSDLAKVPGMNEANIAKLNATNAKIDKALKDLVGNSKVQSGANADQINAAIAAANGAGGMGAGGASGKGAGAGANGLAGGEAGYGGVNLDGLGGGGVGAGNVFGDDGPNGSGKNAGAKGLKAGRVPAGVAGKKRMFNGDPIGVSGDSIFEMMNRRYQVKTQQNHFLDLAIVAPK